MPYFDDFPCPGEIDPYDEKGEDDNCTNPLE